MTTCKKHPRYRALRKPTADCPECRRMRCERLGLEVNVRLSELFHLGRLSLFDSRPFPKGASETKRAVK